MRGERVFVAAVLVAALIASGTAWAAHLTVLSKKEFRSGPETPGLRVTAQLIDPSNAFLASSSARSWNLVAPDDPDCTFGGVIGTMQFQIDPDPGEQVGDSVVVDYYWDFNVAADASNGEFGAQAGFGGGPFNFACSPLNVSFGGPARIVLDPLGTPTVEFSRGPSKLAAPPNPASISDSGHGVFGAFIGDTILAEVGVGSGLEWTGQESGTANASASSSLQLTLRDGEPVPALGWVGLGALALLLAAAAAFALKR